MDVCLSALVCATSKCKQKLERRTIKWSKYKISNSILTGEFFVVFVSFFYSRFSNTLQAISGLVVDSVGFFALSHLFSLSLVAVSLVSVYGSAQAQSVGADSHKYIKIWREFCVWFHFYCYKSFVAYCLLSSTYLTGKLRTTRRNAKTAIYVYEPNI